MDLVVNVMMYDGVRQYTHYDNDDYGVQIRVDTGSNDLDYSGHILSGSCGSALSIQNMRLLYCRRQRGDLIEVFKILNSHYHIDFEDIFTLRQENFTRGHQMKLFKPRVNSNQ